MSSHLLVFSAPTRATLTEHLRACSFDDPPRLAARLRDRAHAPWRLVIVGGTPRELEAARARALTALERTGESGFVLGGAACAGYADPDAHLPKAACLFPGFGVRRTRLVADLARTFPRVERWLDGLGLALGTWSPDASPAESERSAGPPTASLDAILLADVAMWQIVGALGWRPDAVAGHSFGENAALVASGIVDDFPTLVHVLGELRRLADATPAATGGLGMLAISAASRPVLDPLLASEPPRVWVALDNCPQQIVVWGDTTELAALERAIVARREVAFRLPGLERPVHTPLFPLAADDIRPRYARVPVGRARVPAWSAASAAPFPGDAAAVRDVLAGQWHRTVRFRELVAALHADGVRTFVEVGPADRLSGFVRDTLRGTDAITIATNVEGRGTLAQLQAAMGQLFVRGYAVDLARLAGEARQEPPQAIEVRPPAASGRPAELSAARESLEPLVARHVAAVLSVPADSLDDYDRGFFELGLGSIGCIALVEAVERELGRRLPQTLPFDHPTIRAMAAAIEAPPRIAQIAHAVPQIAQIAQTRAEIAQTGSPGGGRGPIAVVGMACRFPGGADSPAAFWQFLEAGGDAVTPVPADRSSAAALDPAADPDVARRGAHGAFLADIRGFDAALFGISPREAMTLDPQQRLLLELAWEALEHAAIDPRGLAGGPAGVFVGISHADYAARFTPAERLAIGGYLATGNAASTAAGRISFVLGLRGPSLAVDTACSSSLAAVHLACESLRRGESAVALAGGVNLLVGAETTVHLARARALSPTGRCRTFDAAADGYVRGEGGGMLVLKPLDRAEADGDRVLAVIRGSAMNHDGRTSGLSVPNGPAQEAVVRQALVDAGVGPERVGVIETHGTGTSLGDPIELNALAQVFGGPRDAPLHLGAVKTNIGHLEAAAGVAGLVKAVLQLRARRLAPTLHFATPNPRADWAALGASVVTASGPWDGPVPRLAGVSAFGISGTNVHVVVGEADDRALAARDRGVEVLPVSAETPGALQAAVSRLAARLRADRPPLDAVARTLATGRAHLPCRLAVVAATVDEAAAALERASIRSAPASRRGVPTAWLFTGQGAQTPGMGRTLYAREPVFRAAVDRLDRLFAPLVGGSVAAAMFDADAAQLTRTGWAQPTLFTLEYALAALWHHWGLTPAIVAGHSIGELAAAAVAGVFELEDAVRLVTARARLTEDLPAGGAMLAANVAAEDLRRFGLPPDLDLAAVNAPEKIVLSGAAAAIERADALLTARGIRTARLNVSHAFHSERMAPAVPALEAAAAAIAMRPPRLPLVSNVTGDIADRAVATPGYWGRQLRGTVQFARTVDAIVSFGAVLALELGPRPILCTLAGVSAAGRLDAVPSLAPPVDEARSVAAALAKMYEAGAAIRWDRVHEANPGPRAELPTYPFERDEYWVEPRPVALAADDDSARASAAAAAERSRQEIAEAAAAPAPPAGPSFADRLAAGDAAGRARMLTALVSGVAGAVLGMPPTRPLDPGQPLVGMGFDSLMALQLSAVIKRESRLTLPPARVVDGSSVQALVAWLLEHGAEETVAASTAAVYVDGEL